MYIGFAGFAGAIGRYLVSGWSNSLVNGGFPTGTLVVNVAGSFFLGLLYTLTVERVIMTPEIKSALLIGFLGSFTTFSTFSLETFTLFREGSLLLSVANLATNVFLSITAVILGIALAKLL